MLGGEDGGPAVDEFAEKGGHNLCKEAAGVDRHGAAPDVLAGAVSAVGAAADAAGSGGDDLAVELHGWKVGVILGAVKRDVKKFFRKGCGKGAGGDDSGVVETKNFKGRDYATPVGQGYGVFAARTRWRLIRDGIGDVLRYVPAERRAMVANLQYAWLEANAELQRLEDVPGQGVPTWEA